MDFTIIGYDQNGNIRIEEDGVELNVPNDDGNRHYQSILEWVSEGNIIPPYVPPGPSQSDVWTEKDRRLALGFNYDFGDSRGVQRIGTTPVDMEGWDEVSKFAQALINTGNGSNQITIMTDTGVVQLTALEWQGVMLAAAAFRQPIWGASFIIASMDPIPSDYATNDSYWS